MDYCHCGKQATGRCTRGDEFVCLHHAASFPWAVSHFLTEAGHDPVLLRRPAGPPLQVRGVVNGPTLCPSCYEGVVDEATPTIGDYLAGFDGGSIERAAIRVVRSGYWQDARGGAGPLPIGPNLITAVNGRRPDWVSDSGVETLAALYATMAPPVTAEVVYVTQHRSRTFLRQREKITSSTTSVGNISAWSFLVEDDHNWRLWVGPHGTVGRSSSWRSSQQTGGTIYTIAEYEREDFFTLKAIVESPPARRSWFVDEPVVTRPLIAAIEKLLG